MSLMRRRGFDGVSTQTSLVVARMARPTSAGSVMSTKVVSSPQGPRMSRSRMVVP